MNSVAAYRESKSSHAGYADLMTTAERELSAFFRAVTELLGSEQAELWAAHCLHKLNQINERPASIREWRSITAKTLSSVFQ
jgi:hypothetical protein